MIKIGMHELEKARRLQEEAAKLHLPCPPVASFKISRTENGKIKDIIHAKSNSYVRNAYNFLTSVMTFAAGSAIDTSYFGDGTLSFRTTAGNISGRPPVGSGTSALAIDLVLGTNGTPDTLDDSALTPIPDDDWTGSMDRVSAFDNSSRRFITLITRHMYNTSGTTYEIKESGIIYNVNILMIRDTFPPVTFAPGDYITFTYQLEVYYPPVN